MEATFATFPGNGQPPRKVQAPSDNGTTTLMQFLEAAGEKYDPEGKADYAIDGKLVTSGAVEVRNGSTVTKTARVAGGA
ncbi:hypothetical protein A3C96_03650 [Candidatus Uhrbacteria bacterium RIFCSPHIGHO2_02_FULL_60_10]|uniref:TGS domain-containing protein n=1 Tax=Candidatus Uhrbacteria bacterium RIFCSPHIGHO2_02_FULL_60_10 TaxID=1802392 RepID=A0A1F7U4A3_9BACT|nr:MAG: hypothetical protein A3C96_03650 [Candidatus Uhrbacteria bacterium RIFCSPHIGHO2_02_FULL_60_10]